MNNQNKFEELREKYKEFYYHSFQYEIKEKLEITYNFEIPGLCEFHPQIKIRKEDIKINPDKEYLEYLIFQIGLIECISYVKCTCSKDIIVEAGYIDEEQKSFLKKLYYNGLGELLYTNGITVSQEDLFNITCTHEKEELKEINYEGKGNLICIGGGKDSCVALEIMKSEENNSAFIINPKHPSLACAALAGYDDGNIMKVERILDREIIKRNQEGFLNGHTPFSSIIAFISYLCAYLAGKKNIILSNESSANEATVIGTNINHQYSKTFEFENDFREYISKLKLNINYFSILRGLSEYKIADLFSNYRKYHKVFKSCNLGSKEEEWKWCCNCPKCLFIYIILSPFLTKEERVEIFGEDLYSRTDLLETFKEIIGYSDTKPFECVGTYEEARYAISKVLEKDQEHSYLLNYYKENYPLELDGTTIEKYNEENNLGPYYNELVKKELSKYDRTNR